MHLIIYISDYTGLENDINQKLEDICTVSKEKNPEHGITGLLFYHAGNFLQAIEGEKIELESLMNVLEKDDRHKNITRVVDEEIHARGFPDWNMDTFNLDANERMDRKTLFKYKDAFSKLCSMDSAMFIEMLKSLYEEAGFRNTIL